MSNPGVSYSNQLRARYARLQAEGVLDIKVWLDPTANATVEELAKEMLDIFDCYEQKRFVDITHEV